MTTVSPHIPTRTLDGNNIPNFPYPIRRLLCATHPAAVDTPHPAFQPYPHHIASFKIVFDDSQRNKRNGAKPFRMCFAVETEGQTTTVVDESRVISIDTKVYAHKAFSNAYTSYKKGRFGVTMLSNDISYVVHGYVKAIPKDVVMMYVATPEDVQSNSMNKHPSMHPSYALSVGATYTVSFFATHAARKSRIRYVDTVSDADSSLVVLVTPREREADNTLFQTCPCHEDTSQPIPLHYSPETTHTHLSTPIKQEHAFDITKFVQHEQQQQQQQQQQDTLPFTIHPAPTSQLPVHTTPPTTTSHLSTPPATTSHLSMHPHHKRHLSITTTTQTSRSAPSSPTGTSPYNSSSPWSSHSSTVTVSPAQALAQSVSALSLREGSWDAMNVSHSPPIIHPDPTVVDEPLHHIRQRVRTGIKQHSSHHSLPIPISPSVVNDSPGNPNKGRRLSTPTLFSNAHHPHHALIPSSRSRSSRSPSRTSSKSAPSTPQLTQRTLSSFTHYSDHLTPPMNDIDTPIADANFYESPPIPLTIPIPQTESTYDTTSAATYDTTIPTTHSSYDTTSAAAYQSHMDTSTPHHGTSTIPDMAMPRLPSLPTDIRLPSLPTDALSPSTLSTFTSPPHFNYTSHPPHHSRLPSSIEMSMSQVASLNTPKHTRIPSYDLNTTPKHTRIPSYPVIDLSSPMASSAAARVTSPTSLLAGSAAATMGVNAVTSIDESSSHHHHIRTLSSQLLDSFSPFLTSPSPHHTLGKSLDFTDPVWSNMMSRLNEEEIPPLQSMGQV